MTYTNAYAEGITGRNTNYLMYDLGFESRKEATDWLKENRKQFKTKVTQKDRGYGALGTFYGKVRICRKDKYDEHRKKYTPAYMHNWHTNCIDKDNKSSTLYHF